jgi:hypothetical protein
MAENDSGGNFRFRRMGDFADACSPRVVDLDEERDNDVIAVSAFNDSTNPEVAALVRFENGGRASLFKRILARAPPHVVVVKAADMNSDGAMELITGCSAVYEPRDRAACVMIWERSAFAADFTKPR